MMHICPLCILVTAFFFTGHPEGQELLPLSPRSRGSVIELSKQLLPPGEKPKRTSADYRALWKTAIHQQILLLRMEKENQRLEGESYICPTTLKYSLSWPHSWWFKKKKSFGLCLFYSRLLWLKISPILEWMVQLVKIFLSLFYSSLLTEATSFLS